MLCYIQEVIVDFEAHTISSNDFNGVKKLLQQVWDNVYVLHLSYYVHMSCVRSPADCYVWTQVFLKAHVNTSEMTDLIIQQNHVGSVIKVSHSRV